jgi:acyl carrier protein
MKFNVFRDQAGEWRWNLRADNGRIIADSSEGYVNREDCLDMLFAIRADAGLSAVEVEGVETVARPGFRTEERVRKVLMDCLLVAEHEVTPGAGLVSHLGADSLDVVEIEIALEEEFGVEVPDAAVDAGEFQTVGDIAQFLKRLDRTDS